MLRLDEAMSLLARTDIRHDIAAQCAFGAQFRKLSSWVSRGLDLSDMSVTCTHKDMDWSEEGTGNYTRSPHPPTQGTKSNASSSNDFVSAT